MPKELADKLRAAIRQCGQSARALEKATGVPHPTITRFLAGADMRLSRAEVIAAYLGGELQFADAKKRAAPKPQTKGTAQ